MGRGSGHGSWERASFPTALGLCPGPRPLRRPAVRGRSHQMITSVLGLGAGRGRGPDPRGGTNSFPS